MHPRGCIFGKIKVLSLYRIRIGVNGEVKTRTGTDYGTPGAAVTYTKQQKLRKTALIWLQEQEQYYSDLYVDVIEVWVVGKTAKIRWLQRCF